MTWERILLALFLAYLAWRLYRAWNIKRLGGYLSWKEALFSELLLLPTGDDAVFRDGKPVAPERVPNRAGG